MLALFYLIPVNGAEEGAVTNDSMRQHTQLSKTTYDDLRAGVPLSNCGGLAKYCPVGKVGRRGTFRTAAAAISSEIWN